MKCLVCGHKMVVPRAYCPRCAAPAPKRQSAPLKRLAFVAIAIAIMAWLTHNWPW